MRAQQVKSPKIVVDHEKCVGCLICVNRFGCPAINFDEELKKATIDQNTCRGCKVCIDVCPQQAISEEF